MGHITSRCTGPGARVARLPAGERSVRRKRWRDEPEMATTTTAILTLSEVFDLSKDALVG